MECGICMSTIKNSCIGSCTHHFCYTCLLTWCKKNNTCPVCRTTINQIMFDKEFDKIVYKYNFLLKKLKFDISSNVYSFNYDDYSFNYDENDVSLNCDENDVSLNCDDNDMSLNFYNNDLCFDVNICYDDIMDKRLLITLKNSVGPGVVISKIDKNGRAYHYGLREKDVILFVNNISCVNHKQVIDIFNYCDLSKKNILCKIIRK